MVGTIGFSVLELVTMLDRESAERAVKDANPIIDGRKANVNLAYLGAKPRNGFLNSNVNGVEQKKKAANVLNFFITINNSKKPSAPRYWQQRGVRT
ncbi:hypothetical protein TYRP_016609, partial [Tyrophagus putrescentiae]